MFTKIYSITAILCLWLLLHGCSQVHLLSEVSKQINPQNTDNKVHGFYGYYKVGKPYQINGKWYYPQEPSDNKERGVASWYGPGFHGKETANGAIFDMHKVSAAHKTLPLPALVNVINLENGKKLKVLVNDRGPYKHGRIIDLSKRAAELLGFKEKGVALVEMEYLPQETVRLWQLIGNNPYADSQPVKAPNVAVISDELPDINATTNNNDNILSSLKIVADANADDGVENINERWKIDPQMLEESLESLPIRSRPQLYIQAGAFGQYTNAVRARAILNAIGKVTIGQIDSGDTPLFRVRLGPLNSVEEAEYYLRTVHENGFPEARILVVEK